MLWTIALILLILWALGLITGYTMGYYIHILLVIAIIMVLVRVIQELRPVSFKKENAYLEKNFLHYFFYDVPVIYEQRRVRTGGDFQALCGALLRRLAVRQRPESQQRSRLRY